MNDHNALFFQTALLAWFDEHGRHDLPWQHPLDSYRIWIAEIMLQQTQVKTVIPYFRRFIERFPDILALVSASEDEVLAYWSGLGYYRRARYIYQTAYILHAHHQGCLPDTVWALKSLPGIGASTAAAIAAQAFNVPAAILDGNVKRVLSRYFKISAPPSAKNDRKLQQLADLCMAKTRCQAYTQAIMDLGALCCTPSQPHCHVCPVHTHCQAYLTDEVALYPVKKLKQLKPTKTQQFLLLTQEKQVYLIKRPTTGIWGGLWCLPEIHDLDKTSTFNLKLDKRLSAQPFLTLKHTLTHFHLFIEVYRLPESVQTSHTLNEANWFDAPACLRLGLPKPVTTILEQFFDTP
ncbi:MAG: A/G-specific adenine glycosylase [Legionellaceae bacterium]|mgnify:CR=1 FL=1|nr:A/G-specific adenine glycosylase [Legionellaceae bacterium]HCA90076.1 A/G-specific adenine glycosylase [Legionellales bacterium]|tara:strand:- start:3726 stop:4772 length:1047 start_codon:yes stop_codon:yes gene_type:complete